MPTPKTRQGAKGAATNKDFATPLLEYPPPSLLLKNGVLVGALKAPDAARYLSLSLPTVRRLVEAGLLRPNRITRHLLFPIKELDRFLNEGMVE